jgi:hypothetical protein
MRISAYKKLETICKEGKNISLLDVNDLDDSKDVIVITANGQVVASF